jgi:hypothetical protein
VAELAFFGVDDRPCLFKDGFHKVVSKYDERGNVTEGTFFGVDDRPINVLSGAARLRNEYGSAGQLVQRTAWKVDPQGQLRLWSRVDDRGRMLEMAKLTASGRPRKWPEGNHRWTARYDARGNRIEWVAFGLNGEPVSTTLGYHRQVSRFDARGRLLETAHFGIAGEPAFRAAEGAYRILYRYDDQGRLTDTRFLGPNDRPRNTRHGYARLEAVYRDGNADTLAFAADGKAVPLVVVVTAVMPGSVAEHLGLKQGDVLLRYRGQKCLSVAWLLAARTADDKKPDDAEIEVQRDKKQFTIQVKPGPLGVILADVAESVALPKR